MSEQLPAGGIELSPEEIDALGARWSSCWTPGEVAELLTGLATPWYVAAGWALDLFRGMQTREHGDIEIGIPAARFLEVRDRFPGLVFDAAGNGQIWEKKDQADFEATVPHLTPAQRATLAELLARVHPDHHWLADL